jgi:hypothetical protein
MQPDAPIYRCTRSSLSLSHNTPYPVDWLCHVSTRLRGGTFMLRADGPAVVTPVELHPLTRKPWVDQVPRRLALEAAGALIKSAADPASVTGVRWEGQIIAAGQLCNFEAAELADLCDQMEDVVKGPASRGVQALPVKHEPSRRQPPAAGSRNVARLLPRRAS